MQNQKSIIRISREKERDERDKENSARLSNYHQNFISTEKNKKLNSHRHHLMSCEQIITLAKKKLASSMHDLNSNSTIYIKELKQLKNTKKAKKKKEKKTKAKSYINHKTPILKCERYEDNRNYPFSTSNSFIQFSQKEETLNSKTLKNKIQVSDKIKYVIKPNHAATIIQKHWRGYMTRKLLQQYIGEQEHKLKMAIVNKSINRQSLNLSHISQFSPDKDTDKFYDSQPFMKNQEEVEENLTFMRKKNTLFYDRADIVPFELKKQTQSELKICSSIFQYQINKQNKSQEQDEEEEEDDIQICKIFELLKEKTMNSMERQMMKYKKDQKNIMEEGSIDFDEMLDNCKNIRQSSHQIKISFSELQNKLKSFLVQIGKEQEQSEKKQQPITQLYTIDVDIPTQQLSPHKNEKTESWQILYNFLLSSLQEIQEQGLSETAYMCEILKKKSQIGPQNMVERCLIQITVQILTNQYQISEIVKNMQRQNEQDSLREVIKKWIDELNKWQMGIIEQVSGIMQESELITE